MPAAARSPRLGYALAAAGAAMWGLNGSLAAFLLEDGVSALRLAQLRSAIAWLILAGALAALRPGWLRVRRGDVPRLAFLGICGLALVHATYFLAIDRLPIGVALTIQYLGPLLVLLWLRVVHRRRLPRSLWAAAALSVAGCVLVVRAWDAAALDVLGVLAAFGAAATFAIYLYTSEQAGQRYRPATTLAWAFGFASLFWAVVQPWWNFPWSDLAGVEAIALALGVAVVGTLLPFVCMVAALRHVPASRAAIVATLEPVLASLFAWLIHGQVLAPVQLAGGALVIGAVLWVQAQRAATAAELAPTIGQRRGRRLDPAASRGDDEVVWERASPSPGPSPPSPPD